MIRRDSLLRRQVTEHRMLLNIFAAHRQSLLEGEANQNQEANISHCDILSTSFCTFCDFFRSLLVLLR